MTESFLEQWYNANYSSLQAAFDYHYHEKVVLEGLAGQISPQQYTQDALYFRDSYQGKWDETTLRDGTRGWRSRKRVGNGGIYSWDGRIVSYWYR